MFNNMEFDEWEISELTDDILEAFKHIYGASVNGRPDKETDRPGLNKAGFTVLECIVSDENILQYRVFVGLTSDAFEFYAHGPVYSSGSPEAEMFSFKHDTPDKCANADGVMDWPSKPVLEDGEDYLGSLLVHLADAHQLQGNLRESIVRCAGYLRIGVDAQRAFLAEQQDCVDLLKPEQPVYERPDLVDITSAQRTGN